MRYGKARRRDIRRREPHVGERTDFTAKRTLHYGEAVGGKSPDDYAALLFPERGPWLEQEYGEYAAGQNGGEGDHLL